MSTSFDLDVAMPDGPARSYTFDRDRVVVGRGTDVDLRIEHAAVSRKQLAFERIEGEGLPRFRIVPLGGRNPTCVNGQPAIEGRVEPGESVTVGPIRLSIVLRKRRTPADQKRRTLILATGAALVLCMFWMLTDATGGAPKAPPAAAGNAEAPLFHALPPLSCPTAEACAARARERYQMGRELERLAQADAGNLYKAAVEFAYAQQLRAASGQQLPELADAGARIDRDAAYAQQLLDDARFRYRRASEAKDPARAMQALLTIESLVPEQGHPIRLAVAKLKADVAKQLEEKK